MQRSNKIIVGFGILALLIGIGIFLQLKHGSPGSDSTDLRNVPGQNTNLRIVHVHPPPASVKTSEVANTSDLPRPPRGKVEEYLRKHDRNAASLLAAFHALQDTNYLREAATNFPNDPRVQCTILARDAFPEDRRKWLDSFKTSSPSNSLGNYLSARDYFKNNQPDAATQELLAALGKSQFKDYSMDTVLDGEDLGRFSGSSAEDTRNVSMSGMSEDLLPELATLKGVAENIRDLEQQYVKSGDAASAQILAQMGLGLSARFSSGDDGKFLISQLVGMGAEAIVLDSLDKNTSYDFLSGQTPAQRLAERKQERASIRELSKNFGPTISTFSEDQKANYWERQKVYGELEAMRWLAQQSATAPNGGN